MFSATWLPYRLSPILYRARNVKLAVGRRNYLNRIFLLFQGNKFWTTPIALNLNNLNWLGRPVLNVYLYSSTIAALNNPNQLIHKVALPPEAETLPTIAAAANARGRRVSIPRNQPRVRDGPPSVSDQTESVSNIHAYIYIYMKEEEGKLELKVHHARIESRKHKAHTDLKFAQLRGEANALERILSPEKARKKHPQLYEALAAIQKVIDASPLTFKDPSVREIPLKLSGSHGATMAEGTAKRNSNSIFCHISIFQVLTENRHNIFKR